MMKGLFVTAFLAILPLGTALAQPTSPAEPADRLAGWRASALLGTPVKDAAGRDAGKVEDLVVDANGRVSYLILASGGFLGIGDKLLAVPWPAAHLNWQGGRVASIVLDVNKESLERAPAFARDRWPDLDDWRWADDARKFWSDAVITGKVKARLAQERAATLTNVDIDTRQGVVTLSGTVESEHTRQRAAELAQQVDGVARVHNSLTVR